MPIYIQDCSKEDPTPGQFYCLTGQLLSDPTTIPRGCVNLQEAPPEWHLPEPPVGGAVCVDVDTDDKPPEKVFKE